ncbi:MAG: hypothetical protein ACYC1U_00890 [Candidatus Aquicultorales bacterium]
MSAEIKTKGAFVATLASSLAIVAAFFVLATALGKYGKLDIYMGSVYVFVLSMIVMASLLPPLFKKSRHH